MEGKQILVLRHHAGEATFLFCIHAILPWKNETQCVEGRQFAMMASQGLDLLWSLRVVSVTFLGVFASGSSNNGMYSTYFYLLNLSVRMFGCVYMRHIFFDCVPRL